MSTGAQLARGWKRLEAKRVEMGATEALIDALMMAARGGVSITEIVIDEAAYAEVLADQPRARKSAESFTFDGPANPVLIREGPQRRRTPRPAPPWSAA